MKIDVNKFTHDPDNYILTDTTWKQSSCSVFAG